MTDYLLIALFVMLEGFFSGSETGFYSLNKIRLRFRAENEWPGAALLKRLSASPQVAISSMLVGTNLTVYASTTLCARNLRSHGVDGADFYSSLIMPPVLLICAEIIPKFLFQRRADTLMYRTAPILKFCQILFYPLLLVLRGVWWSVRRMLHRPPVSGAEMFTPEKFHFVLRESTNLGVLSPYQRKMAGNVFRVKSMDLEVAMVPLEKVVMVDADAGRDQLRQVLEQHRYNRLPVYSESHDNIIGVINVIDLLARKTPWSEVRELSRELLRIDLEISVAEALYSLQREKQQMALVADEEGTPAGIVTVKDLVEEIVGELHAW
jgi:CBS domain containing-hemolysin-like protein